MTGRQDQLRARLSAIDPMLPTAVPEPLPHGRADQILEKTMAIIESGPDAASVSRSPRRLRTVLLAGAAAVAVAAATVTAVILAGDDADSGPSAPSTLSLSLGSGDTVSSCIPFDVEFLRDMPVALAGTVTEISADAVTLDVERWYAGGDADVVSLGLSPGQTSSVLDGVDFQRGGRYLIASTNGLVNGCGFSGEATPELEAAYAEAFPT